MEQKFSIGLNSKINLFSKKFGINRAIIAASDLFESFSNYIIVSNLLEEDFDNISKISTGKSKGIDGIAIIINDKLVCDESDLDKFGENEKLNVNLCFIQSTTEGSFNTKKFQAYVDEVVNFLINQTKIEPFSDVIFKKLFNEENDYLDRLKETPKIYIYYSSGCTNHKLSEQEIENERKKVTARSELQTKFILEDIFVWQEKELNESYDSIDKFLDIPIKFNKSKQLDEKNEVAFSLISSIKFGELRKLIETKEGLLREKLFLENPRSVIENSNVNDEIKKTLSDNTYREYFLYLNNGLTILCDQIRRHEMKEDVYYLTYPRIINGCQTTHMLFDHHAANPNSIDELEVFAKVIATENKDLKRQIIFATNNQNSIDKDLQALNDFHNKLEEYFQGIERFELLYERLRGQHSKISPPYKKIDIENLAKVYSAVVLRLPHEMKSNAIKKIEKYQSRGQIFRGDNYGDYYLCAILYYYLNYFLANNVISLATQTMDMHLLMSCNLELTKQGKNTSDEKIVALEDSEFAKQLFIDTNSAVLGQTYLFERRGFYSGPKTASLIQHFS